MGQMEMKCIFNIGKNYFYMGQGYSGGDVAHGPLVNFRQSADKKVDVTGVSAVSFSGSFSQNLRSLQRSSLPI
jgi:hypothetical protein